MLELIGFMMQQFLPEVILKLLFNLILTWKSIIFGILSKFILSIKESNSLNLSSILKDKSNISYILNYFETKEYPITCYM